MLRIRTGRYRGQLMSQFFSSLFHRRQNDGWFRVSRFDATTVDVICALAVGTMFLYALNPGWFFSLTFIPDAVTSFEIWRLVTWPLVTPPNVFALISIVFFWSFGQNLEGLLGRNKFLSWVVAVTLVPALLLTVLSLIIPDTAFTVLRLRDLEFGIGTLFLCGIWLYAATYPRVRFFDIIPIWAFAGIFTLLDVLSYTGNRALGKIIFLFTAIATALLVGRSLGAATGWPIPHIPLGATGSGGTRNARRSKPPKSKRNKRGDAGQRVVDGPWRKETSATAPPPSSAPPAASPADQAELDGLLDKIGADGMDSLSGAEKKRLNELSKRLRNR